MMAWTIFVNPVQLGVHHIWLILPLCAAVAIVYKAIRVEHIRQLPRAVLSLWAYMAGGFIVGGIVFWILVEYFA